MEKVINGLIELSDMVNTAITMAKNGCDLNGILRRMSFKQMQISADHFEFIFDKSSKKIEGILKNEKQENI